jgi:hypothetical protein
VAIAVVLGATSARAEQPPAVVFLNFSDGTESISFGERDDATRNVSSLCAAARVGAYWGSSDCGDRSSCASVIGALVEQHFRDFNVVFTLERPSQGAYTMALVGPPSGSCGFGVAGAAPLDCDNGNPQNVVFAFECASSSTACSVVISQELAHSFGLAHTHQTCDILSPGSERCAEPIFSNEEAIADDPTCGATQNNYGRLLDVLGPWTGGGSHRLPTTATNEGRAELGCAFRGGASPPAPSWFIGLLIIGLLIVAWRAAWWPRSTLHRA